MKSLSYKLLAAFFLCISLQTQAQVNETDSLALLALYSSTDGDNWTNSWDLTQPVSTWDGITFEASKVKIIDLENRNLTGNIPDEIGNLDQLRSLLLRSNNLSGSIPTTIGDLTNLEFIYFESNQLSGPVPSEITNLTNLVSLYLIDNNLNDLPDLSDLNLSDFYVSGNSFEFDDLLPNAGILSNYESQSKIDEPLNIELNFDETVVLSTTTPDDGTNEYQWLRNGFEIANETSPTYEFDSVNEPNNIVTISCEVTNPTLPDLVLVRNDINISFRLHEADSLALLSFYHNTGGDNWNSPWNLTQPVNEWSGVYIFKGRVSDIVLSDNGLTGAIPSGIGSLSDLTTLALEQNSLSGKIPPELWTLTKLSNLNLYANNFSGEVSNEIGNLTKMALLNLGGNSFSGSIPSEIGNLSELDYLKLGGNQFEGDVPESLTTLNSLSNIFLENNRFTSLPDFSGNTNISFFSVYQNEFEFDDLLPNATILSGYEGQANVGVVQYVSISAGGSATILADTPDDGTNEYQWYVNNAIIKGATNSTYIVDLSKSVEGVYHCLIRNPRLPDLTLRRNDIIVKINEAPTDISIDNNSVDEGMPVGTVVGVLSSTDINESDTHTYTLVSDFGHFNLRGDTLVTNEIFDFNIAVAFFLEIQSTDDGGLSFIKDAIRIDINDLNDIPTDLLLNNTEISENLTEGTLIGELSTIDYDLADSYTYTIIGQHPEFRIEGNQLLSNVVFDFEKTSTYEFSIRVEDDRGATFEKEFTITIIDEEDPLGFLDENKDLNFYPNPTKDWMHLHLSNDQLGLIELTILDVTGRVILSDSVIKEEENLHHKIDVKNLTKGAFFIKVIVNGNESLVRFIKQ